MNFCIISIATGPSSWELYTKKNFKGSKSVAAPGRYDTEWLRENLGTETVTSARSNKLLTTFI